MEYGNQNEKKVRNNVKAIKIIILLVISVNFSKIFFMIFE